MKQRLRGSLVVLVMLTLSLVMISCKQETETLEESTSAEQGNPIYF